MKLSKTLMINAELLPSNKKAFTLAEVLITLSILGVVAALTIPSLVNRNSDIAAQTKIKKAIASYETFASVYMAENEASSTILSSCDDLESYFKIVEYPSSTDKCKFKTSDGAYWVFQETKTGAGAAEKKSYSGSAVVYDDADSPRYGVALWNANNRVNMTGNSDGVTNLPSGGVFYNGGGQSDSPKLANSRYVTIAKQFMKGSLYCKTSPGDPDADGEVCKEKTT